MKRVCLILLFISIIQSNYAQSFPAEIIESVIKVEVTSDNELNYKVYKKLKINNFDGKEFLEERIYYSNLRSLKKLDVKILDKNDKVVRRVKKDEITDKSAIEYLYDDNRVKIIKPYHNVFPFYVVYEYSLEYKGFLSLPDWYPQPHSDIPVIHSKYELKIPSDYQINYRFYNFEPCEGITIEEDFTCYSWDVSLLDKIIEGAGFTPMSWKVPRGEIVSLDYNFGGLDGSFRSWEDYGNWMSELIEGLDDLPESEIQMIIELTSHLESKKEKIEALYKYLQTNTRYINVYIGIGGLVPHNAEYVCLNGYGDCKALVNYMKAMLKSIGIESKYVIVKAGAEEVRVDTGFVSQQFNHVILLIPLEQDTVWLECTNQNIPFNYLGSFTEGKFALLCDFEKSGIVNTPVSGFSQNYVNTNADIYFKGDSLMSDLSRELSGIENEKLRYYTNHYSEGDFEYYISYISPIENSNVLDFNYDVKIDTPIVIESLSLHVNNHTMKYNEYLQVDPLYRYTNIKSKWTDAEPEDIQIVSNYKYIDTLNYSIPINYFPESVPREEFIQSIFGEYQQSCLVTEDKVQVIKSLIMNRSNYDKEEFNNYISFLKKVNKVENQKIVFIKNEE